MKKLGLKKLSILKFIMKRFLSCVCILSMMTDCFALSNAGESPTFVEIIETRGNGANISRKVMERDHISGMEHERWYTWKNGVWCDSVETVRTHMVRNSRDGHDSIEVIAFNDHLASYSSTATVTSTYNAQGELVYRSYVQPDLVDYYQEFEYNEQGKIIRRSTVYPEFSCEDLFSYDGYGNLLSYLETEPGMRKVTTYNNAKPVEVRLIIPEGDTWREHQKTTFQYDGNQTITVRYFMIDGEWHEDDSWVEKYDRKGRITSMSASHAGSDATYQKETYSYRRGMLVRKEIFYLEETEKGERRLVRTFAVQNSYKKGRIIRSKELSYSGKPGSRHTNMNTSKIIEYHY